MGKLNYTTTQINGLLAEAGTALQPNSPIVGATKPKITFDANGLVTAGADLVESDIPNLSASVITSGTFDDGRIPSLAASKITSGQFADERISSANTWNGKSAKATVYTGTLLANGWSNNEQTLTISGLAISGMAYTVSPTSGDFEDYASAMIWANDVTVANNITFNCKEVPSADIDIIILGCEVA